MSFLFGTLVIALYAGKRLGELISPPKGAEYDFTSMLTLPLLVGRETYNRAYVFYVFLLLYFYLILCVFQPLIDIVGGKNTIKFEGAAWPLTGALLVVGVLPATPVVAQIEQALRSFAYRIANIPDDFYNRVTALSAQEIENVVAGTPQYEDEIETFWKTIALLSILGIEFDDAVRGARRCVSLRLFGEWTLEREDLWSYAEYQRYADVVKLLTPQYVILKAKTEDLLDETASNAFVKDFLSSHETVTVGARVEPDAARDLRLAADQLLIQGKRKGAVPSEIPFFEDLRSAREAWKDHIKACEIAAKRLIALFSIIARNDKRTLRELVRPEKSKALLSEMALSSDKRYADPGLRFFAKMLRSNNTSTEPWYNSILLASGVGFVTAYFTDFAYRILTQNSIVAPHLGIESQPIDALLTSAFVRPLFEVSFPALATLLSGCIALFMRSAKLRNEEWLPFYDIRTMPLSSYVGIFTMAWFMALPALTLQWIVFYARGGDKDANRDNLVQVMQTNAGVAIAIAIVAVGLCIITDIVAIAISHDTQKEDKSGFAYKACVYVCILPVAIVFGVLIASPGYIAQFDFFVGQVLVFISMIFVTMAFYVYGLEFRMKSAKPWRVFV
ncbi:hypothetical protein LB514_15820 [Mesorhizobium sp. CA17]|nr:hypothetical protein [Mesorhizobium sp. CA17]